MRGAAPGEYRDEDLVVIVDPRSPHFGAVGLVKVAADQVSDTVHFGDRSANIQPRHIRRVRPGDRVLHP